MTDIPGGYTKEEWDAYQADPCAFCMAELDSDDSGVRYNAVDILRGLGETKPIARLSEQVEKDPDAGVRAHIAFALQELCDDAAAAERQLAMDALDSALEQETDDSAREEIKYALGAISEL